jgi:hypothetical protein
MASAQRDIKHLQQAMAKAHEEAETAKATYEAEEAKSNKLKTQYAEYEENMKKMYAEGGGVGAHKWPLSESSTSSGNLMWSQNAKAPEHKNSNVDPSTWKVDTENMEVREKGGMGRGRVRGLRGRGRGREELENTRRGPGRRRLGSKQSETSQDRAYMRCKARKYEV